MANRDIAIIGIAGKFPDAENITDLYHNLREGKDSLNPISNKRLIDTTLPEDKAYRICGYLDDIDKFDHRFFKISMAEAQTMDPHQRILLETVYHTLETAGYDPTYFAGSRTSLFVADSVLNYYEHADEFVPTLKTGNVKAFLGAYIASFFKLTGNVSMVDTSCSSSLVAVHLACNDLLLGDADYAIACGINLDLFPVKSSEPGLDLDSPDGKSRPFSAQANGMSFGEAAVCVLLKPFHKAVEEKDIIYAVIKGSAINNNAGRAVSLTAPDSVAQAEVIKRAWENAAINPRIIEFIEAHGSGTQLGDTIEIAGLNAAFQAYTTDRRFCAVSTAKTNLGHARGAAGLVGFARCVLALQHKVFFPATYFDEPSPYIDFENSAVFVNDKLMPWKTPHGHPRHAGITSIGLSGTNCHMVLQEAPELPAVPTPDEGAVIVVSAATKEALKRNLNSIRNHIAAYPDISLHNLAYTLAIGRQHFSYRFAVVAYSLTDLTKALDKALAVNPLDDAATPPNARAIVLLTDHATQVSDELIRYLQGHFPDFKEAHIRCASAGTTLSMTDATVLTDFSFQYAFYKWLSSIGVDGDRIVAVGKGKILLEVLRGDIPLSHAVSNLETYTVEPLKDLEKRVELLLEKEGANGPIVFVDFGADSKLSSELKKKHYEKGLTSEVCDLPSGSIADLLSMLAKLYFQGANIRWQEVYKNRPFIRIMLPTYAFDKTRCWIREKPRTATQQQPAPEQLVALSSTEKVIASIWAEVLGKETIFPDSNFFDIGGDSLLATKVINKINKVYSSDFDFEDIFDFKTVSAIAKYIEGEWSTEQKILFLWKSVLKLETIHAEDNFFELGGHSLIANQIINGIVKTLGVRISFDDFFQYPTVRSLASYLNEMKSKPHCLALDKSQTIPQAPRRTIYPLSHAQKRLWILSQWEAGSVAYNQCETYQLKGKLNKGALLAAFEDLIRRHESLRTVFVPSADGEVGQKILDYEEMGMQFEEISLSSERGDHAGLKKIIDDFARKKFDLRKGPLIRIKLIELDAQSHVLLFSTHHIISDGWSGGIISREVFILYKAFTNGRTNPLRPLRIQYKDYTEWLNGYLTQDRLTAHRDFWTGMFKDGIPTVDIPTDKPRPPVKSYQGDRHTFFIDPELTVALKKVGLESTATLFMSLLTGLNILLYHYTGQSDLVVGTASAGRDHPDLENQVGFYVNTIPVRTTFGKDDDYKQILNRIKTTVLDAFRYQHYPFDLLISDLKIDRDLSRSPLFDVWLVLQNTDVEDDDVQVADIYIDEYQDSFFYSRYDLMFNAREYNNGIRVHINFSTELFHKSTIAKMANHFTTILSLIAGNSDQPVSGFGMLSAAERVQLLRKLNPETALNYAEQVFELRNNKERNIGKLISKSRTGKSS